MTTPLKQMRIIFNNSLSSEILKAFGKTIDKQGYIVSGRAKKRVFSQDGDEIRLEEFAGVIPGSEIYLKSDIVSLIKYVEGKLDNK